MTVLLKRFQSIVSIRFFDHAGITREYLRVMGDDNRCVERSRKWIATTDWVRFKDSDDSIRVSDFGG